MKKRTKGLFFWSCIGFTTATMIGVTSLVSLSSVRTSTLSQVGSLSSASRLAALNSRTGTPKEESKDFVIDEHGKLTGLTEQGKKCNSLVIPPKVTEIDAHAFKDCSRDLKALFIEGTYPSTKLKIDQDGSDHKNSFKRDLPQSTEIYVVDAEVGEQLASDISFVRMHLVTISGDKNFFIWQRDEYEYPMGDYALVGLTSEGRASSKEQFVVPKEIVFIGSDAFAECPETLKTVDLTTTNQIKTIGDNAFKGATHVTNWKVKDVETALQVFKHGAPETSIVSYTDEHGSVTLKVSSGCYLQTNTSGVTTLIGLVDPLCKPKEITKEGEKTPEYEYVEIDVPEEVSVIGDNAITQSNQANPIKFLNKHEVKIAGRIRDCDQVYMVYGDKTAINLVNAGVTGAVIVDENWAVKSVDGCIMKEDMEAILPWGMIDLTEKRKASSEELLLPKDMMVIEENALNGCHASQIVVQTDDPLFAVRGTVPDVNWIVKNNNLSTAVLLFHAGVTKPIVVEGTGGSTTVKLLGKAIVITGTSVDDTLLGVKNPSDPGELDLPPTVSVIAKGALDDCKAKYINFRHVGDLDLQGSVPADAKYEVNSLGAARVLENAGAGAKTSIVISDHGQRFTEKVINGCIVRTVNGTISLVGLLDKRREDAQTTLTIPEEATIIEQKALDGCQANHIKFLTDNIVINGTVPDTVYEVNNAKLALALINAGVKNHQIIVHEKSHNFYEYVSGNWILRTQVGSTTTTLLGLTKEGKTVKDTLTLPSVVNEIGANAFTGCVAKTLDFGRLGSETNVIIDGKPFAGLSDVQYKVDTQALADKLVKAGVDKDAITVSNPASVEQKTSSAYAGMVANSILIVLVIVALAITIPVMHSRLKKLSLPKEKNE